MEKCFLECMWNNLNDLYDDGLTDDEIRAELEEMGIDVDAARKSFEGTLRKCKEKYR